MTTTPTPPPMQELDGSHKLNVWLEPIKKDDTAFTLHLYGRPENGESWQARLSLPGGRAGHIPLSLITPHIAGQMAWLHLVSSVAKHRKLSLPDAERVLREMPRAERAELDMYPWVRDLLDRDWL